MEIRKVKGLEKYLGLMFRSENTMPIEIVFDKEVQAPIHSWFVFFDFMAYWYDAKGELIQSRFIQPFESEIKCSKPFIRIIEIPRKQWPKKNSVNTAKE